MTAAEVLAPFEARREPALLRSLALSLGMHALLVAVLLLGVSWQSREPEPVVVELWRAPPPSPPAPAVDARPVPVAAPRPEPKVEQPDIALPTPKPKPPPLGVERKPDPKIERKPEPKVPAKTSPAPVPARPDPEVERRMREQLAHEQARISAQRQEEELRQVMARQEAAGRSKSIAGWVDKIRAKIRGNIQILPPELSGNPEAIFDVTLLPSGDILSVKLRKSSGHRGYDDIVERAILKSSPLPPPDDRRDFQRQLELKFRPQDK